MNETPDPLAGVPGEEQQPVEPDEDTLSGYNPSQGEAPPEAEAEAEAQAAAPDPDEDELPPADPDETPAGPAPEEEEYEPEATAEEETIVQGSEEGAEAPPEPEPEPSAEGAEEGAAPAPPESVVEPDPAPTPPPPAVNGSSKNRVYIIFEETRRSGKVSYSPVEECLYDDPERSDQKGLIEARNGENARRAAYRRIAAARGDADLVVTLVPVAIRSFQPKTIKPRARNLPPALEVG